MSIELKQAVQQALDAFDAFGEDDNFENLFALSQKMEALRTAIQQAEAKTDEPVGYMNAGNIHELKQGELPYGYVYPQKESGVSVPVYTHPAQGVQDALKDHQIAAMVNTLRDIARQFHGHDSLRERIANVLVPALKAEAQQPVTGEPVQADSSEYLRVIASLGAALRRLSFAAQTTGGTAGPDAELQSAIGQAEQALSLGGIGQAMFATGEPKGWTDADADAARLAMELECLLLDTKDTAAVSRWWKSANEALDLHRARLAAAQVGEALDAEG